MSIVRKDGLIANNSMNIITGTIRYMIYTLFLRKKDAWFETGKPLFLFSLGSLVMSFYIKREFLDLYNDI